MLSANTTPEEHPADNYILSNDPLVAGLPDTPAPVICDYCAAERHTKGFSLLGMKIWWNPGGAESCICPEGRRDHERAVIEREMHDEAERKAEEDAKMRKRVARVVGESGMGERFLQRTFMTFVTDTPERKQAARTAKEYVENFDNRLPKRGEPLPERNGFFISGTKGSGKTHIAAAIANYLLSNGTAVICMTERDLFGRIRRTYSRDGGDESEVLETYKRVPLLIIDDLGKEKPTDWTISTLYSIIDGRYDRAMPLIITTNYDPDSLARRLTPQGDDGTTAECIIDRMNEVCAAIILTGKSWRTK